MVSPEEIQAFQNELATQIAIGDFLVTIGLRDQFTGNMHETLMTVVPNGVRFGGPFPSTARIEGFEETESSGTVCKDVVVTRHLWGSPAETFRGCVRSTCNVSAVTSCIRTESNAFGSFFSEAKILPDAGTQGTVIGKCCLEFFSFAWATGFKSVEIEFSAQGVKIGLKIIGNIGQSGNGSFTVEECCPRSVTPPPDGGGEHLTK